MERIESPVYRRLGNSGLVVPSVGIGCNNLGRPGTPTRTQEGTNEVIAAAVDAGISFFDIADLYGAEPGLSETMFGTALTQLGLDRDELTIVTKFGLPVGDLNGNDRNARGSRRYIMRAVEGSLRRLGTDYIDLLLVHQPFGDYYGTYRAMEKALAAGKVRAIGVSNFFPDRFVDLAQHVEVPPAVNQMETHVFNQQADNRAWYAKYDTALESWGPLAQGRNNIFTHPVLTAVGEKHGKTAAQVALRYLIQLDIIVIPKTVHRERMVTNLDVTDFQLDDADMRTIAALDEGQGVVNHYDPAFQERLASYTVEAD